MFPIPWNFPFRKKDGSLSTISAEMGGDIPPATASKLGGVKVGSGLSVTSDGTLSGKNELPAYTVETAGKVLTVGDDGSLEWDEKGTGGGNAFLSYDFTKVGNFTINGVVMSANGAEFNSASDYFELIDKYYKRSDITLYVDTGNFVIIAGSVHQRFITTGNSANCGLIWRYSNNTWSIYDGNNWCVSEITDLSFFDNCTFKIYIDASSYWHIYKNNVLVLESLEPISAAVSNPVFLGSDSGQSISTGIIKAVRVYSGNYTE